MIWAQYIRSTFCDSCQMIAFDLGSCCKWFITICGETPKDSARFHIVICGSISVSWHRIASISISCGQSGRMSSERSGRPSRTSLTSQNTCISAQHLLHSSTSGDRNFLEWKCIFRKENNGISRFKHLKACYFRSIHVSNLWYFSLLILAGHASECKLMCYQ
jgi:hypothetical protein